MEQTAKTPIIYALAALYGHPLFSALAICLLWLTLAATYRLFFHPLASIPGPRAAAVSNLYQVFHFLRLGRFREGFFHQQLHEKYGPVVRYGPNSVITNLPHALPLIYHRKADKTAFYVSNNRAEVVFNSLKHEDHVIAKRRLAYGYSMSAMKRFEEEVDVRVAEWIAALKERYSDPGRVLDIHPCVGWLAYDIITEIAFGEPVGFVKEWEDKKNLIEGFETIMPLFECMGRIPTLGWLIRKTVGPWVFANSTDKSGLGALMGEADRLISKKGQPQEKNIPKSVKASLLWRFMTATAQGGDPMTPEQVKLESLTAMIAGSRTMSEVITPLIYCILGDPRVYQRFADELTSADAAGKLGPLSHVVAFDTAQESLPYTAACIRESLRLMGTHGQLPRVSPPEGVTLNDIFVPAGASISTSPFVVLRCKALYGDDADEYKPERWLDADTETVKMWDRYNFRWGYGARACLGKNIAVMEIWKICVQFFRVYDPVLVDRPEVLPRELNYRVVLRDRGKVQN